MNLITCCHKCNSSRGNRSLAQFVTKVAGYVNHGVTKKQIINHIERSRQRVVDVDEAKELIARRGGFSAALKG